MLHYNIIFRVPGQNVKKRTFMVCATQFVCLSICHTRYEDISVTTEAIDLKCRIVINYDCSKILKNKKV